MHLKSFLNFLRKNKLYTAINIFGFAVSLMFVVLFGLYLQHEYSVDSYHGKKDRLFRMERTGGANWSIAVAGDIAARYPEIEATVNVHTYTGNIRTPEQTESFREEYILTDSVFFSVFDYDFIEGTPGTALRTKQDVVLDEAFARKLFGDQPALGKTVEVKEQDARFTVSGVVRTPGLTHMPDAAMFILIDHLPAFVGWPEIVGYNSWGTSLYVLVRPNADLSARLDDMLAFFQGNESNWYYHSGRGTDIKLVPVERAYFSPVSQEQGRKGNSPVFLSVLTATVLVILFFAVINYINLSVAQAGFRAKEASMRQLLGGSRGELFKSFMMESVLLCFVSLLLGLMLATLLEGWFCRVMNTEIVVQDSLTWGNLGLMLGGILVLGCLSGIVPALMMIRFKPIEVVRGTFRRHTKMVYSKLLIGFQYAITIILLGCTITIVRQLNYMMKSDLGFERDFILVADRDFPPENQDLYRNRLAGISGVQQVAFARGVPMFGGNNQSFTDKEGMNFSFTQFQGDTAFMSLLGLETIYDNGNIDPEALWLNETAWKKLGLADDAMEYRNGPEWFQPQIRGRIKDFHFRDFTSAITEVTVGPLPEGNWAWNMLIKVSSENAVSSLREIERTYDEISNGKFFDREVKFMNQQLQVLYQNQQRLSSILSWLSVLAIVISSLGMLAMATYFMRQRSQEIALRKVFGAMNREVLLMLMLSFLKLVLVAFVISVPVIWYLMNRWLSDYAYRIPLSWNIFVTAGLVALLIAGLTILWQSLRAVHANPVLSLKE